jgi:glycogen debranching enzyme
VQHGIPEALYALQESPHDHRMTVLLMSESFYSGWGIRTVAMGESRFNPMSYHNGSIWPHDNALIAAGKAHAVQVLSGMFEASGAMNQHRLPELFCGFVRRESETPTLYPVACSPQAWASTTVFYLLQACLGISFERGAVRIDRPMLPPFVERLALYDLRVGEAQLDLVCQRHEHAVSVNILRKTADVEVAVLF